MTEYENWLQKHIDTCSRDDIDTGRCSMLKMCLAEYRRCEAKELIPKMGGMVCPKCSTIVLMPKEYRHAAEPEEGGWGGTRIENCLLPPKPPQTTQEAISLYQNNPFFNQMVQSQVQEILTRSHKAKQDAVEPLAVLADRKGLWVNSNQHSGNWCINMEFKDVNQKHSFSAIERTYADCEAAARKFLEGLDYVKGGA